MIEIRDLTKTNNQEILECFNLSFSDYFVPICLNHIQFETKIYSESIDKEISVGAFKENKLIGFVLHGKRNIGNIHLAYNAGTGVIPAERKQALTTRMYDFIKPILRAKNIDEVILEVISNNIPAIKSYKKIGFKPIRNLSCFIGEIQVEKVNEKVRIHRDNDVNLEMINEFGDIEPTWQYSNDTILRLGDNAIYVMAYLETELCGYCILNSLNNRIIQIAVKNELRNKLIGSTLLKYVQENISESTSVINVDSRFESTLKFFENRNLKRSLTQLEMKLLIGE